MKILNLTQHKATPTQKDAGVVDLNETEREELSNLLTVPISGTFGIEGCSLAAVSEHLEQRAADICSQFVLPRVMENARAILHEGGYEADGFEAFHMLRPEVASGGMQAMVGGFAPLVERLIPRLRRAGVEPVYALSDRKSKEVQQEDGSVRKENVFVHCGFFPAL